MPNNNDREEELTRWVEGLIGQDGLVIRRLPGGGRHEAWEISNDGGQRWFLRADSGPPSDNEHYTLRRESEIYAAAHDTGIPVPAMLGVHPTLEAVLLEHISGEAGFASLPSDAQTSIIADFAPKLAQLHAADPAKLSLPSLHPVRSIAEHVVQELDIWQTRIDNTGQPNPFLTACFQWLRANNPDVGGPPSLVQGDTGPGNFLHNGSNVTAFLDFELAHLSDPLTDLAWVATRNAQEPVPDFSEFIRLYVEAGGAAPDQPRLQFHALFAELRIAALGADRVALGGEADLMVDAGAQLIFGALHYRLTVEALATATGQEMPEIELPQASDTNQTIYFDTALAQMRHVIGPHVADDFAARRLKNMARVLKYLREVDRVGDSHTQAEMSDLSSLLGHRPNSIPDGRTRLEAMVRHEKLTAVDLLSYAAGRAARTHQLLAPAMGALANRHLPDF